MVLASDKEAVTRLDSDYMQQYDAHIERKKRKKQRLIRRFVLFSIIVMLGIGSLSVYHFNQRQLHAEKTEQYEQMEEELAALQNEEKNLKEEIMLLEDEEYVLDIARTNYFFSKEGETIFKIPDEEPSY